MNRRNFFELLAGIILAPKVSPVVGFDPAFNVNGDNLIKVYLMLRGGTYTVIELDKRSYVNFFDQKEDDVGFIRFGGGYFNPDDVIGVSTQEPL